MNVQTHPKHQPKQGVFTSTSENLASQMTVLGEILQHKCVAILETSSPKKWDRSSWKKGTCAPQELGSSVWAGGHAGQQTVTNRLSCYTTRHARPHYWSKTPWTPQPWRNLVWKHPPLIFSWKILEGQVFPWQPLKYLLYIVKTTVQHGQFLPRRIPLLEHFCCFTKGLNIYCLHSSSGCFLSHNLRCSKSTQYIHFPSETASFLENCEWTQEPVQAQAQAQAAPKAAQLHGRNLSAIISLPT